MAIVYVVKNRVNGMVYVGVTTTSLRRRMHSHTSEANKGIKSEIYKAMRDYGILNFEISQVERCKDNEMLDREEFYIQKFNSMWPSGYNTSSSHLKGGFQSDIVKEKKSKAQRRRWKKEDMCSWSDKMREMFSDPDHKEAHRQGLINSWTEERREEYRLKALENKNLFAAKGYLKSGEKCSKSVILFDSETKTQTVYKSVSDCARQNNWSIAAVSKQLKVKNFLFKRYLVKFGSDKASFKTMLNVAKNKNAEMRHKMSLAKKGKPPWNKKVGG